MSQPNLNNSHDTRFTKIFVGNLSWRTTADDLRTYFQQFGEIIDANVVCETYPGRSKGYGFVTFRDNASTLRALENPKPIIDGRTANCNLASLGVKKDMNQFNTNGPSIQARPPHQYQPNLQYAIPYCSPATWPNPVMGQYVYMSYGPRYPYPTHTTHNGQDVSYMRQHNWQQAHMQHNWEQPARRPVKISAPQRSSVQLNVINETDQAHIVNVAHHENEEAVTEADSDVDQQNVNDQNGDNIGQDGDIKQDVGDQEGKINEQEG